MGTLHKIRPDITDDLEVDEPEHDDGDGEGDDEICLHCLWWCSYANTVAADGHPLRGSCRYNPPPWAETDWEDWCRCFQETE